MPDMLTIVPSRGRPHNVGRFIEAFAMTTGDKENNHLCIALDDDDPELPNYCDVIDETTRKYDQPGILAIGPRQRMVGTLNAVATEYAGDFFALMFAGDDHVPRTCDWDVKYVDVLKARGTGIVYGNDLIHGPGLPTQCAMTSDIVRALGYMAPPTFKHLYVDNVWKAWGEGIKALVYLENVVIEHCHPLVDKAPQDAGYDEVNAMYAPDGEAWAQYRLHGGLQGDLTKLRGLF